MLIAEKGTTPPKVIHPHLKGAISEAKRISRTFKSDVKILKVIGEVKTRVELY